RRTGAQSCALVRFFKTHPYEDLDGALRAFARRMLGGPPSGPAMKCLVLLATAGHRPEWNSRRRSCRHQALPLPSAEVIVQSPMLAQLVQQFGLELNSFLEPDPSLLG